MEKSVTDTWKGLERWCITYTDFGISFGILEYLANSISPFIWTFVKKVGHRTIDVVEGFLRFEGLVTFVSPEY
jgi:hypothetical protein